MDDLDVATIEFQTSVLNQTERDLVTSNIISQLQGDRAKKKESMRMRDFLTRNVNSYARILNDEKSLKISKTTMICQLVWKC